MRTNQIAIYLSDDIFYQQVVNQAAALRWHHQDGIVILTKTASNVNAAGKEIGQPWYSASRATFMQKIKGYFNQLIWWPWEFEL